MCRCQNVILPALLGWLLACPGLLPAGQAQAAAPELKKLHILMVIDTQDEVLSTSVKIDQGRMKRLWAATIPHERYSLKVLDGKKVTRRDVLGYYDRLKAGKDEGLVFYYAGHGSLDKTNGKHFFELSQEKKPLFRHEVRGAMEKKGAGLVVLLTDCCSTPRKLPPGLASTKGVGMRASKLNPAVRCLLFQARGTVDITAATDNASWSDNQRGGLFTRSLARLLEQTPLRDLDKDRDGVVTWTEFFPQLRDETKSLFKAWSKELLARGDVDERTKRDLKSPRTRQVPRAFSLQEAGQPAQGFAAVGIENGNKAPLHFSYRWEHGKWADGTLAPGEKKVLSEPLARTNGKLPQLEMRFGKSARVTQLEPTAWAGEQAPRLADLAWFFRIQKKAPARDAR
jgi:hypothetical protein